MKKVFLIFLFIIFIFSCKSVKDTENDTPTRTTSSVRLGNIEKLISEKPIAALNQIYMYKEIYSVTDNSENEDWRKLAQFEKEAIENLCAMQDKAVAEERWDDAVTLGRSITSIGIKNAHTGKEAVYILESAKKKLKEGDNLGAFLAAVKSHEMQPMDYQSAVLFLEKAIEGRQRRSSAFFLAAAQTAGGKNIPANLREYAQGRDTASDMIKGVATVLVDRGYKIERGYGVPDKVLGSAFFVDASGLLITNYHVIASEVDPKRKGYSRMYIRMGDSSNPRVPARVIGWDQALDLALIKTEINTDYVFSLVDRVIPRIGDTVLAMGSPIGLQMTVTSGIVSALGRRFLQIGDVIQIDAAVNHGNSGGPVVDNEGRLVGIVFAGVEQHQGLNFAIPAEMLAAALPSMLKGGKSQRPWLGMTLCETYSEAEIIYTAPNTPAFLHKVREGVFIKTINGKTVTAPNGGIIPALQNLILTCGPGELVVVETIDKNTEEVKKKIMMTVPRPDLPLLDAAKVDKRDRIAAPLFGMILTPLQSTIFSSSFRVNRIVRGSIADEAGISVDDPVFIARLRLMEEEGYAVMDISVKKRRMGYIETPMQLPAYLNSPDTL
jgi:serine protease Do